MRNLRYEVFKFLWFRVFVICAESPKRKRTNVCGVRIDV